VRCGLCVELEFCDLIYTLDVFPDDAWGLKTVSLSDERRVEMVIIMIQSHLLGRDEKYGRYGVTVIRPTLWTSDIGVLLNVQAPCYLVHLGLDLASLGVRGSTRSYSL
jgi:hypothetical protein